MDVCVSVAEIGDSHSAVIEIKFDKHGVAEVEIDVRPKGRGSFGCVGRPAQAAGEDELCCAAYVEFQEAAGDFLRCAFGLVSSGRGWRFEWAAEIGTDSVYDGLPEFRVGLGDAFQIGEATDTNSSLVAAQLFARFGGQVSDLAGNEVALGENVGGKLPVMF